MTVATKRILARYQDVGLEGVVHYSNYDRWFDMVQTNFLEENGIPYQMLLERGLHFTPVEMQNRYYRPIFMGQAVLVELDLLSVSNVKTVVEYRLVGEEDGVLFACCKAVYACINKEFRPVVLKRALPELFDLLECKMQAAGPVAK